MKKTLALAALAAVAALPLVPAAASTATAQQLPVPVGVSTGPDGTCVTVSYQVPQCVKIS